MGHDHSHDDPKSYYVEQLCTIGICGALGGVAVMLYERGLLWFIAEKIRPWVLVGGIALLALVAVHAVIVWLQAGRTPQPAHDHDHEHDHDHADGHDHSHGGECAHDHDHGHSHAHGDGHGHGHSHGHSHGGGDDHGHEHGWAPWRFVILLLPVVLYFLNMPNESMQAADLRDSQVLTNLNLRDLGNEGSGEVLSVDFPELQRAPKTADNRRFYEGKTVRVKGEFLPGNEGMFTLVRYRMNCCARDAVALSAFIVLDPKSGAKLTPEAWHRKWVEVEGQVQFQQRPDQPDAWLTLIVLRPTKERPLSALVKVVPADASYYLF
jgi:hypothetical protein